MIEAAFRSGAKFDLWNECFDYSLWQEAFAKHGMDIEKQAQKKFATDQILPWDHLGGPERKYLLNHFDDAMKKARDVEAGP